MSNMPILEFREEHQFRPGEMIITARSDLSQAIGVSAGHRVVIKNDLGSQTAGVMLCTLGRYAEALHVVKMMGMDTKHMREKAAEYEGLTKDDQLCILWVIIPVLTTKERATAEAVEALDLADVQRIGCIVGDAIENLHSTQALAENEHTATEAAEHQEELEGLGRLMIKLAKIRIAVEDRAKT